MFIDYVTLMLINMAGGLVILSFFLCKGLDCERNEHWAPAFATAGLVATICGFAMSFTWPLPKPYNIIYGEMSVLFGVLFLAASWAIAKGWSLLPVSIYAFFAGAMAVLMGARIIDLSMTNWPGVSGAGFILTGLGGIFAGFTIWHKKEKIFRMIGALVLLAAAAIWAWMSCMAYWFHVKPPA